MPVARDPTAIDVPMMGAKAVGVARQHHKGRAMEGLHPHLPPAVYPRFIDAPRFRVNESMI
jgi:hypothetical protein